MKKYFLVTFLLAVIMLGMGSLVSSVIHPRSNLTIQQVIDETVTREGPGREDGRWIIFCRPGEKDWSCVAFVPADSNFKPDNRP